MDGGGERIRWARQVRLPVALTVAQLAAWPVGPLVSGAPVDPVQAWRLAAVAVVVGVALSWRAAAPVAAWAVCVAAVGCVAPLGLRDVAFVVPFGDIVALYAVALHRTLRVGVVCAAASALVSTLVSDVLTEPDVYVSPAFTIVADAVLSVVAYAAVVIFGRARRRRTARREAVRVHVAGAAEQERAAAARERERLSQELHDVSAHHLTAVVVQLAAAQRLRDPAMTAQALDVARTSGRAAARSLHRLVALADRTEQAERVGRPEVGDLVAGFARLGLRVELRLRARPEDAGVAEMVHVIVQEALTNVLRYAPGATVTVTVSEAGGGAVAVTVEDSGDGTAAVFDLGSGAGLDGLRARAARLGGTLTAGHRPAGGWAVQAVLPARPGTTRVAVPSGKARAGLPARVLDGLIIVLVAGLPLLLALVAVEEEGLGPLFAGAADAGMTALFLIVYCGPLWWRRRAPVPVLGVMLAGAFVAGVVSRAVGAAAGFGIVVPVALCGLVAAVYAAGRYDIRHPGVTWLAAAAAGAVGGAVLVVRFVRPADLALDGAPPQSWVGGLGFVLVLTATVLGLLAAPWWLAGLLVARHHAGADRRDRVALRDVADRAVRAARDERARIAAGLRDRVLRHIAALLTAAGPPGPTGLDPPCATGDRGTPAETGIGAALGHARAALTAMRELLTVLRVSAGTAPRAAQPTLAGLAELCGAGAVLEVRGEERQVPLEVELCAFRVVETVLPLGSRLVVVEHAAGVLRVSVRRLAHAVPRPVLAALRERVDAVGGSLPPVARQGEDGWRLDVTLPLGEAA